MNCGGGAAVWRCHVCAKYKWWHPLHGSLLFSKVPVSASSRNGTASLEWNSGLLLITTNLKPYFYKIFFLKKSFPVLSFWAEIIYRSLFHSAWLDWETWLWKDSPSVPFCHSLGEQGGRQNDLGMCKMHFCSKMLKLAFCRQCHLLVLFVKTPVVVLFVHVVKCKLVARGE